MFKVSVKLDRAALSRSKEGLVLLSKGRGVIRKQELDDVAGSALKYLQRIFPSGGKHSGMSSAEEFGQPLAAGWKVSPLLTKMTKGRDVLSFQINHQLERRKRVNMILRMVDEGTTGYSYVIKNRFRFFGRYRSRMRNKRGQFSSGTGFVTMQEGRVINVPARDGVHFTDKTEDFIINRLLPEFERKVRRRVAQLVSEGR